SVIRLVHGEPITFAGGRLGVHRTANGELAVVEVAEVGTEALVVHDAHAEDPAYAFALSRLSASGAVTRSPIGVLRDVQRPVYDDQVRDQAATASGGRTATEQDLQQVILGRDAWTVAG